MGTPPHARFKRWTTCPLRLDRRHVSSSYLSINLFFHSLLPLSSHVRQAENNRMGSAAAQIPTSFGHELRACLRCRLVKTYDQFRESGCENCPFFKMDEDHERVVDCTTPNFTGIISVMDPSRSWAARWLRIGRFVPGCYTLAVSEALPEDLQNLCEDERVPYIPPKRV